MDYGDIQRRKTYQRVLEATKENADGHVFVKTPSRLEHASLKYLALPAPVLLI